MQNRTDGGLAREQAFLNLDIWRHHLIRRYQHTFLDHGEAIAPDVTEDLLVPANVRRVFTGAAIAELARRRLIRKASSPRHTTQNGQHGSYVEIWQLAADHAGVKSWKLLHPVPLDSEP